MGARLRICLTPEQKRTLFELRTATTVPQRVKDRAEVVRLNAQGWYVEKIAIYFNWHMQTVRETIHRWETKGLGGLWEASGRGGKRRWQKADIEYVEACLRQDNRTYNAHQLAQKLATERQVQLSPDHLRRVLKKKGVMWKRTRVSHRDKQAPEQRAIKQAGVAAQEFANTGRIRVIVQDNGSIHTSTPVQQKWAQWEAQGLYLFFLPAYCSEMNLIESEWHQLKTHELAGQMFEDELDLAYAVMDGLEARGQVEGRSTERFKFKSG